MLGVLYIDDAEAVWKCSTWLVSSGGLAGLLPTYSGDSCCSRGRGGPDVPGHFLPDVDATWWELLE